MMIKCMKKSAIIKVLRYHNGLPLDPNDTESKNYVFFKKVFDTLREKYIEMNPSEAS